MNFADGFVSGNVHADLAKQSCLTPGIGHKFTTEECARQIYDTARHVGEAGKYFDYNSMHYNLALFMAVKRSGMSATEMGKKWLLEPAGMKNTFWLGEENPAIGAWAFGTGEDYAN